MAQISSKFLILLVSSIAITSPKSVDLSLQQNFWTDRKAANNGTSGECPTWMYRAKPEQCICGVDNYHTVKCDQSDEKVYILDSYQMNSFEKK